MKNLSRIKLSISKIYLFILLIILGLLVCVNCYKAGDLMIGIPDYAVTSVLMLVLAPLASVDLKIVQAKARLGGYLDG